MDLILLKSTGTLHITLSSDIAVEGSCGEMNALDSLSIVLTIAIHIIVWTLVIFSGKTLSITEKCTLTSRNTNRYQAMQF